MLLTQQANTAAWLRQRSHMYQLNTRSASSLSIARSIMHAHTCPGFVDGERNISIRAAIALLLLWFTNTQVRWPNRVANFIMGVIAIKLKLGCITRMPTCAYKVTLLALQPVV
jgi:hypothetical protein